MLATPWTFSVAQRRSSSVITPDLWPPNSPGLNPVDYKIWGVMQERVYKTAIRHLDDLKRRLIAEWSGLQQSIVTIGGGSIYKVGGPDAEDAKGMGKV